MKKKQKRITQQSLQWAIEQLLRIPIEQQQKITSLTIKAKQMYVQHMFDFMDDGWTHHINVMEDVKKMGQAMANFKQLKQLTFIMGFCSYSIWNEWYVFLEALDKLNLDKIQFVIVQQDSDKNLFTRWVQEQNKQNITVRIEKYKSGLCSIM